MFAPNLINSATCINLFSNILSSIIDLSLDTAISAIACACKSVGKPGKTSVFKLTLLILFGPFTIISLSITFTLEPISLKKLITDSKLFLSAFINFIFPPVITEAIA